MATLMVRLLVCTVATSAWAQPTVRPEHAGAATAGLDPVIQAVCSKQVVLLGEDGHHAGATTIAVKTLLVRRLVGECGFSGVVFESQFYDMLDFDQSIARGTATREQLADAIGALWSRYAAFAPLERWLFTEAQAGRVRVAGMDPQVGGITAHYSQQQLPTDLSSVLAGDRRKACSIIIGRHNRWEYDDTHSFDASALKQLRGCLGDIRTKLGAKDAKPSPALIAMADSYTRYLDFAGVDPLGLRDRAMYQNFVWIRAHWPANMRIVVWCASVHAAKTLDDVKPSVRPLGSYLTESLGDRAAAIGFSALGGSYGQVGGHGTPRSLAAAAPGTMESRAFATAGLVALRFVDHTELASMGKIPARALDYGKFHALDWSRVLDGVIVLRKETAAKAMPVN
ncbi:erythromycin esterase family protein [Rhodanobacter sp. Root480]|uniref:erythromycin esterase family protein n=1 Tax=Rhodanobacter sp. Root480 TaxID=1736542 RepID=UPI0012E3BF57|nr:erythromycin esterase family protein [Rhodanobacter sp. Root480]